MGKLEAAEQQSQPSPVQVDLRKLSRDQQNVLVEKLFARLSALYGAGLGRLWDGTDLSLVKKTWAEKLGGFTMEHIAAALNACDDRPFAPNLPEFVGLCRDAARRASPVRALRAPEAAADVVAEKVSEINMLKSQRSADDGKGWARTLREQYLAGATLYPVQISLASQALGEIWEKRQCRSATA